MVDAAHDTQHVLIIDLEREAEVACPAQRAHQDGAFILANRSAQANLEERLSHEICPGSQAAIDNFLAELQLLNQHLHLLRPVACKLGQVVVGRFEIEHRRSITAKMDFSLLLVTNLSPLLNHILLRKRFIIKRHLDRIDLVAKQDGGEVALLGMLLILQDRRGVAVGMTYLEGRFVVVLRAHHRINLEATNARTAQSGLRHREH